MYTYVGSLEGFFKHITGDALIHLISVRRILMVSGIQKRKFYSEKKKAVIYVFEICMQSEFFLETYFTKGLSYCRQLSPFLANTIELPTCKFCKKFPAVMNFKDSCQEGMVQLLSGSVFTALTFLWNRSSTQSMILMMRCGGLPKVRTVAMSDGLMV
jgi:hypothetical protein